MMFDAALLGHGAVALTSGCHFRKYDCTAEAAACGSRLPPGEACAPIPILLHHNLSCDVLVQASVIAHLNCQPKLWSTLSTDCPL